MALFRKETSFGKYAITFFAGALTGAAVALLLAPMPGKKLQKQIRNAVEDQVENVDKILKKAVA